MPERGCFGNSAFRVGITIDDVHGFTFQRDPPGDRPPPWGERVRFEEFLILARSRHIFRRKGNRGCHPVDITVAA